MAHLKGAEIAVGPRRCQDIGGDIVVDCLIANPHN